MKTMIQSILVCVLLIHSVWASEPESNPSGLLVAVHGSPSPSWNAPMEQLEKDLRNAIERESCSFSAVKVVNLEFKKPRISDGVDELIEKGCKRIVCMPLFIAHSSHVIYDIPAALGLYSTQSVHETLLEEGASIAASTVPIVMGPVISESSLLMESALERVQELSTDPQNEAVVIFAHGDHGIEGVWDDIARRTATHICAKTGITYADWSFVEVGQSYSTKGLNTIFHAGEYKKRVLVVGLYISMGPERMHFRYLKERNDPFEGEDFEVVFSKRGLLPNASIADWMVKTASGILKNRFGIE